MSKNKPKLPAAVSTNVSTTNAFAPLGPHTETEEKKEHRDRQSETHQEIDKIWKLLITGRRKCRSLQYQFWAAVLIEKEGLEKDDGGLEGLIESILIDARMGDQHISKLPPQYHDKMRSCTSKTFLENKNINGNINKYAAALNKWYNNLIKEIKDQVGDDYLIKNSQGYAAINHVHKTKIKGIIINNPAAKKIREGLNLSNTLQFQQESKEKITDPKSKTGMDYYLDYLLSDDEETAQKALSNAVQLGYVDDGVNDKKTTDVVNDEYYISIFDKNYIEKKYELLEKILVRASNKKNSPVAQHLLGDFYNFGSMDFVISTDPDKAIKYYKLAAKQGFEPSKRIIAHYYITGEANESGIPKNIDEGLRLLKELANENYSPAQDDLGCIFYGEVYHGITAKNNHEAVMWWQKAISQGDLHSKYHLAQFYLDEGNKAGALKLIEEAAEQGLDKAQYKLGYDFVVGTALVPKDTVKGIELLKKSADQGHEGAIKFLKDNELYFDLTLKIEKYPKYHIIFSPADSKEITDNRIKKIEELLKPEGLDLSCGEQFNQPNSSVLKIALPSSELTKNIRDLLGIDRGIFNKISSQQLKALQDKLPQATIEDDPKDSNKMLITWPIIGERKKYRDFVDQTIKEMIAIPSTTVAAQIAKAAAESNESTISKS